MSIMTGKGQNAYELADEFIEVVKQIPSVEGGLYGDITLNVEQDELAGIPNDALEKMRQRLLTPGSDAKSLLDLEFKTKHHLLVTVTCLYNLGLWSNFNSIMMSLYLGFFATKFYETHRQSEVMTFKWVCETVGKDKVIPVDGLFYWFMAAKLKSQHYEWETVFDVMTNEELFRCS